MNIHQAILAVTEELGPIQKNGTLELGGKPISFTRIDDIRAALGPLLVEHGVVSYIDTEIVKHKLQQAQEPMTMAQTYKVPIEGTDKERSVIDPGGREIRDGKIPTTRSWAIVRATMTFVLAEDGSDWACSTVGEAYDTNGDKAVAKATTAAVKRILLEVFKVTDKSEGDDEERDPEVGNRAATTDRRDPEGQDRGGQARAAAMSQQGTGSSRRSGPAKQQAPAPAQPSDEAVAAADEATGEVPDETPMPRPDTPPEVTESKLDAAKARVRNAVKGLQTRDGDGTWTPAQVDALAAELTGKSPRSAWINLVTSVAKVATALEKELEG